MTCIKQKTKKKQRTLTTTKTTAKKIKNNNKTWLKVVKLKSTKSMYSRKQIANRPFARWRHFTTTTRILFVFPFIFKFFNPSEVWITKALISTRKQNPWRILVVVVKWCHRANGLLSRYNLKCLEIEAVVTYSFLSSSGIVSHIFDAMKEKVGAP